MHPYANIAYATLKLSFDKELFVKEYDEYIFPAAKPFIPITEQWHNMRRLNPKWHILSDKKFKYYNNKIIEGNSSFDGITHQWNMINLMQADGDSPNGGGANWRYQNLNNTKRLKPQFENLEIVKWIYSTLPHTSITGIHCVSIEPGGFATIHRDARWLGDGPNPASKNGYYNNGYVIININISDGGVPLLWCLDHEQTSPKQANNDCYLISDYFLHAVPETFSRRRQIRVSMIPTTELFNLIDESSNVVIPKDYSFIA
jgi:hypothetical protein